MPRKKNGEVDHHKALTGDDLNEFVNGKLFPYLAKFKTAAESSDTVEYKIGAIFSEIKNRLQRGYNLREVLNLVEELRFQTSVEKHEMSHLYESKIKNMGNAGRNGGEYYTPRPLIRSIVKVVAPQVGETVYDAAVGSAGFLVEAGYNIEALKTLRDLVADPKSDLFDVLEYISFEVSPITRAERVRAAEPEIYENLSPEQREFVEFVLSRYIETGVEVLDREILPELLKLKYEAIEDAMAILGSGDVIAKTFIEFQKYLYESLAA